MIGDILSRLGGQSLTDTRGQAFTLEAITGAIILLLIMLVALQSTVITPLSASTANQQIEKQNRALANDAIDIGAETNSITPVILNWNESGKRFKRTEGTDRPYYTQGVPDDFEFGELLNESLSSEDIAYNMYVEYQSEENEKIKDTTVVYQGEPSYNAATATKTIFLHDSTIDSESESYIKDIHDDSELYNVVRVRIVVWRM
ncbi:hypothetical protein [Natrinema hispanicum]|uniref:Uncharacterized protein n=1 Tax=Natrinema hispanicum TaxID=392421 RepID=A0A1I0JMK3_9EURY|nr:hypothetical protein [Natrinema hispanicum]SEU10783.1 hypothetical protein SAMN04488694_1473 [Natrinema hispanicum]